LVGEVGEGEEEWRELEGVEVEGEVQLGYVWR